MPQPRDKPSASTHMVYSIAWPLMLRAAVLHSVVVIDAYLVAPLGEGAIASLGLAGAIGGLVLGCIGAFSSGTQIRLSQAVGAGNGAAFRRAARSGLIVNIGVAAFSALAVMLAAGWLLAMLAHSPEIAADATTYLLILCGVLMFEAVALNLTAEFNSRGKTFIPLISYLLSVPVNVALSAALIHGAYGLPRLELAGAAIGSVAGSLIGAAFLVAIWHKERRAAMITEPKLGYTLPPGALSRHFRFVLPIAMTFGSGVMANSVSTMIFSSLSLTDFAALTLIMPWVMIVGTMGMAWSQATGIVVAQHLGAHSSDQTLNGILRSCWKVSMCIAACISAIYGTVVLLSPVLYDTLEDATLVALWSFLPTLLLLPFPKQSNAMCGHSLRAGGDTVYVMNIFLGANWLFRIPAVAVMVFWLQSPVYWVFALLFLEELVKFPLFHRRFFAGKWRRQLEDTE